MKTLLVAIFLIASTASAQQLSRLQIAMTEAEYVKPSSRATIGAILVAFSNDANTNAKREMWMTGWETGFVSTTNARLNYVVAWISVLQAARELRNTLTPAEMTRYENAIEINKNVRAKINRQPKAQLALWDIKRKAGQ